MISPNRFARSTSLKLALAAPLALALAACGSDGGDAEGTDAALTGEPLDPIAPPEGQSWTQTAIVTDMGGVQVGNPDAPIELVEYVSHTCGACANFAAEASGELEEYVESGLVSWEMRNQVHNVVDLTVAVLARCGDPSTFHPLSKQVWANLNQVMSQAETNAAELEQAMGVQDDSRMQRLGEASGLVDFFAARGISRDQAMQCLGDVSTAEQIVENSNTQSEELGVTGTPTFFLNGNMLDGSRWAEIEQALQQAGAR